MASIEGSVLMQEIGITCLFSFICNNGRHCKLNVSQSAGLSAT